MIKNSILMTALFILIALTGCATKEIDYQAADKIQDNQEFDKLVKVKEIPGQVVEEAPVAEAPAAEAPAPKVAEASASKAAPVKPEVKKAAPKEKPKAPEKKAEVKADAAKEKSKSMKREPDIEDTEGFEGRRPLVDPFKVGESVVLSLNYFNITAGTMELSVDPFVEVNGRKAHVFSIKLKSNSMFSRFYAVDDKAWTHVDYETMVPYTHQISVKESKQVRDIRSFFDFKKNKASYWETKVTKDKGEEKKKKEWDILPYSQNVVSALFYLRTFTLKPGKKIKFRLAEDGKNIVCTVEVLRREKLKTDLGTFDTIVVKPEIAVDGVFKPVGDVFFWLTDDDRKLPVRIESEIKIGTIVAKLKSKK